MKSVRETTNESLKKLEQLEHQRQLARYKERKREKARRNALIFKVGEAVLACWPWVSQLTLRPTKSENEAEFAPLQELLSEIASDSHYNTRLQKIAGGGGEGG